MDEQNSVPIATPKFTKKVLLRMLYPELHLNQNDTVFRILWTQPISLRADTLKSTLEEICVMYNVPLFEWSVCRNPTPDDVHRHIALYGVKK